MIEADLAVRGIAELVTPTGNGPLVGGDAGHVTLIENAAVASRDGRFVFVGTEEELDAKLTLLEGAETIDARGGTVTPGFVDAHTHLPFAGWRESEFDERLHGATYSEIAARGGGILSTVRETRAASREHLIQLTIERLDAMLALGTTITEAKSGYGLETEAELKQLEVLREAAKNHPVEVVPTFLGAHTVPAERKDNRAGYLTEIIETMLPRVVQSGLAEYADVFVDANAFSLEEAKRVLTAAGDAGLGLRVHADQLADDGGAALAASLGAASADHLEYSSAAGMDAMARAGTCGVLLPAATFFLRCERHPPGRALIDAGVPVVVATDFNPGSCPSESMGAALWFACLQAGLTVDEALVAATLNAAYSLGRAETAGSIEVGKRADLVIHAIPNRYHLVYRFGVSRIRTVVAAGKRVVR
jgi:imidazolonepropionase